jgi:hypothetical protein
MEVIYMDRPETAAKVLSKFPKLQDKKDQKQDGSGGLPSCF